MPKITTVLKCGDIHISTYIKFSTYRGWSYANLYVYEYAIDFLLLKQFQYFDFYDSTVHKGFVCYVL
jgi:hypothetical protein